MSRHLLTLLRRDLARLMMGGRRGGSVLLPAYTVADVTAQWDLRTDLQLFGRIENLGDVRYQTANGYNQPPRGLFAGLRWRLPL